MTSISERDLVLECRTCNRDFTVNPKERAWYEGKQLVLPKHCASCRAERKRQRAEAAGKAGAR